MRYNSSMATDIQIYLNNFFGKYDFSKRKIGVALSGGRDSVALAYALKNGGYDIVALNVEHGIRGESSLRDSAFVVDFCKKHNIELHSFSVDVPAYCAQKGLTIEQGARVLRYQFFDKAMADGICDVIALAHHLDDQAETVLMRIIRGTGIVGLKGMSEVRGGYIRPLLSCSREEIDEYIAQNNLEYVDDESNFEIDYTRNFLREELKRIKERFPSVEKSFARLSQNASEIDDFVEKLIPNPIVESGEARVRILDMQDKFVAKRLVKKAISALGVTQDIEYRHYPLIFALIDGENGKKIELTHGVCVHKQDDELVFAIDEKAQNRDEQYGIEFCDYTNFCIEKSSFYEFSNSRGKADGTLFFDVDKLPKDCVIRHRKSGDFIKKFGGGTKSVGDFLTDKKVPLRKRENLWVIASENEVFVIVGVEISSNVAIDDNTKNVAKIILK